MKLVSSDTIVKWYKSNFPFDPSEVRFSINDIEMNMLNIPSEESTKWIPVTERLPEMYERVLISVKEDGHNERIELAFLAQLAPWKIRFRAIPHWYEINDVIAWMPLPKPYEVR